MGTVGRGVDAILDVEVAREDFAPKLAAIPRLGLAPALMASFQQMVRVRASSVHVYRSAAGRQSARVVRERLNGWGSDQRGLHYDGHYHTPRDRSCMGSSARLGAFTCT